MKYYETPIYRLAKKIAPERFKKAFHFFRISLRARYRALRHYIRIQRPVVRTLGREWKPNLDIISLLITYDCNLKCPDCYLMGGQLPANDDLSLSQITHFIKESIENNKKWRLIYVMGGEVTLRPDFLRILSLLIDYKKNYSPGTTIMVLTNGYGPQVNSVLAKIPPEVEIYNDRKTSSFNKKHICFTKAPVDCKGYRNADFACGCLRTSACGICLNKYGYYPCNMAAHIDRVFGFNLGLKKLPATDSEMVKLLELFCRYCGGFLYSGYRMPAGFMSPTWESRLQSYKNARPNLTEY